VVNCIVSRSSIDPTEVGTVDSDGTATDTDGDAADDLDAADAMVEAWSWAA
jgi:hypothetical protein